MNTLVQLDSLSVGSDETRAQLSQQNTKGVAPVNMLLISDSHGHYEVLEAIIKKFGPHCSALLFAGDGCWDIAEYISNAEYNETLKKIMPPLVFFVRGNGDNESYCVHTDIHTNTSYPLFIPDKQVLTVAGKNIFLTHGHRYGVEYDSTRLAAISEANGYDVVIYGHTHQPFWEEYNRTLIINPGSCARARGGHPQTCAILRMPTEAQWYEIQFYSITHGLRGYTFEKHFGV